MDWYLIYKTRDTLSSEDIANPLECYLCASQELLISSQGDASQTLTYDDISESFYYVFLENENPNGKFIVHHANTSTTYTFGRLLDEYITIDYLERHIKYIKHQIDSDTQRVKLQRVFRRISEIDKDFV